MTPDEQTALLGLRELIEKEGGLVFPEPQFPVLTSKLSSALRHIDCRSFAEALKTLQRDPDLLMSEIIPALTVGETYFFRNRAQFEALRHQVLPQLMERLGSSSPLVIWSAGCATGEEPYSLSLWIREYAPELWPDRLRILATDINPRFLEKARAGRYRDWSFRQVEPFWRARYFRAVNDELLVDEAIGKVISFQQHNLISDDLPRGLLRNAAALVFCRNVLIYFSHRACSRALELFRRTIMPDGVLMLGHAENLTVLKQWQSAYYPGTYFYYPPGTSRKPPLVVDKSPTPQAALPAVVERSRPSIRPPSAAMLPVLGTPPAEETEPAAAMPLEIPADLLEAARRAADIGDLQQSRDLLARHLQRDRTSIEGYFLSALVAEQLGDWNMARDSFKKALFLDKNLVLGHYYLAVMDERDGALNDALRRYRTVCRLLGQTSSNNELPFSDGVTSSRLMELAESRTSELERMV